MKANTDKFSMEDAVQIYLGYIHGQAKIAEEREDRVKRAISFRKDNSRTGIRPTVSEDRDK